MSRLSLIWLVIVGLILIIGPCSASLEVRPSTNIALAKGDPLTITGTGFMNGSATIWEFGSGFFAYKSIPAAPEGTLSWTQGMDVTETFRSGPLMIIVQDPGRDRQYSLHVDASGETKRIVVGNGTDLFDVKPDSLTIPAAMGLAEQVQDEIAREETDDSGTLQIVFVEEPTLSFHQENAGEIPTVAAGKSIRFYGTMNLAPENRITARVENTAVIEKTGLRIPVRTGTVTTIRTGELQNRWEYTLDTSGLEPGEYLVEIGWEQSAVSGQNAEIFRIVRQSGADNTTGRSSFSLMSLFSVPAIKPIVA
ncbi:hypothetical protein [Methanoregula sp.]|uniref:hypothetical protein n=1 Tax=Methanoregula sp. TaxID=2052170 RepID=UPI00356948A3